MEYLGIILGIIVIISLVLFLSSIVIRFFYTLKKDSIENGMKQLIGYKYIFPIPKSEIDERSDNRVIRIINILLRTSYVLLGLFFVLLLIHIVTGDN